MEFFRRAHHTTSHLGILPGTFNPVTVAHQALASTALRQVDEVVFVLPRVFPHKDFSGATFQQRIAMLEAAAAEEPRWSIAAAEGGLFVEIAGECRAAYGVDTQLSFICGRDAAERIATWDYGRAAAFGDMLRGFDLLVAPRQGSWAIPPHLAGGIRELEVGCDLDAVSATEVRERIARGEPWAHLVPESVRGLAGRIYAPTAP